MVALEGGPFRMGSVDARAYPADGDGPIPSSSCRRSRPTPAPFEPNGYGLHNMTGDVWEWCVDWFDQAAYRPSERRDPTPARALIRVVPWARGRPERGCTRPLMRSTGCRPGSGDSSTASSALTATPPSGAGPTRASSTPWPAGRWGDRCPTAIRSGRGSGPLGATSAVLLQREISRDRRSTVPFHGLPVVVVVIGPRQVPAFLDRLRRHLRQKVVR